MKDRDFKLISFESKKNVEPQSGQGVIEALELALKSAKDGELSNVVIVAVYTGGKESGQIFANSNNAILMCGALSIAHRDFMATNIEHGEYLGHKKIITYHALHHIRHGAIWN